MHENPQQKDHTWIRLNRTPRHLASALVANPNLNKIAPSKALTTKSGRLHKPVYGPSSCGQSRRKNLRHSKTQGHEEQPHTGDATQNPHQGKGWEVKWSEVKLRTDRLGDGDGGVLKKVLLACETWQ
jgi:hypothetical protein